MATAIRMHRTGGPEVMQYLDVEVGPPGPGEVQVRHRAIGLNFIDVYYRTGLYPMSLPGGAGLEGAGEVLPGETAPESGEIPPVSALV